MRPLLPLGIVGFVAMGVGAMLYRAYKPQALTISKEQAVIEKPEKVHARGAATAPVIVEEFGDFQCPPCGAIFGTVESA